MGKKLGTILAPIASTIALAVQAQRYYLTKCVYLYGAGLACETDAQIFLFFGVFLSFILWLYVFTQAFWNTRKKR